MQCPHCQLTMQDAAQAAGQTFACPRCGGQFSVGGEQFDPYYTWLGIPPSEQPANHYRLLGVQLFEPNRSVIENAADRQMKHLQSFKIGARAALSQKLLTEVAAARVQLLDASRRTAYDEQLRTRLNPPRPQLPQLPEAGTPFAQASGAASEPQISTPHVTSHSVTRRVGRRGDGTSLLSSAWVVVGGIAGLAIGVLIVFYLTGQDFLGLSGKLKPPEPQAEVPIVPPVTLPAPEQPDKPVEPVPGVGTETPVTPTAPVYKPRPNLPPKVVISSQPSPDAVPPPPPTSPPTPPSAAPPAPPTQLLAEMPSFVRLPALTSSETTPWFSLPREPDEPLTFVLHAEAATLPGNASLRIQALPGDAVWRIEQVAGATAKGPATAIGEIRLAQRDLSFAWSASQGDDDVRRQLANCLLQLSIGNEFRTVQLREPLRVPAISIELDRDRQTLELDVADPPPSSKLFVKVVELVGFSYGAKVHGDAESFALTRPVAIEFAEMKGPELELRFLRQSSGRISVSMKPTFVEAANRKFDLTIPSLQKLTDAQQRHAQEAQAIINTAQNNLSVAQSTLQSLRNNPPSSLQDQNVWRRQVAAANAAINNLSATIAKSSKDLAEANQRLSSVPEIRGFLESIHKIARIKFAIYAQSGSHELVLVDGTNP
jgi:hypothetical protein